MLLFCVAVELIWAAFDRGDFEARKKIISKLGSYVVHACLNSVEGKIDMVFYSLY